MKDDVDLDSEGPTGPAHFLDSVSPKCMLPAHLLSKSGSQSLWEFM